MQQKDFQLFQQNIRLEEKQMEVLTEFILC